MLKPDLACFGEKNRLQSRQQGIALLGAGLACSEAWVVGEMGKLRGFTETQPPIVRMRIDGDIVVLRMEDGVGLGRLPVAAGTPSEDRPIPVTNSMFLCVCVLLLLL